MEPVLTYHDLWTNLQGPFRRAEEKLKRESEEIARELTHSNLAERLVDGEAALPDIYSAMPWYAQVLEKPLRPRNVKQLTRLVCRHLRWYLDQSHTESL